MLFADLSLARRIEYTEAQAQLEYWKVQTLLRQEIDPAVLEVAGGVALFGGAHSLWSRAVGLGLDGPVKPNDMDQVEEFYRRHGSATRIDLCPLASQSLVYLLGERGFRTVHFDNIWALPLREWRQRADSPPGIEVRQCRAEEEHIWLRTVTTGFGEDTESPDFETDRPYFHIKGFACFLALVDGLPAAGASVFVHGDVAMLFADATLPAYRRRGAQTALIDARLEYALSQGCELATVQTDPGTPSQRNVQRAGFQLAYTKMVMAKD